MIPLLVAGSAIQVIARLTLVAIALGIFLYVAADAGLFDDLLRSMLGDAIGVSL